jgi:ABC-type amino acid transport substrate-binding protein
LGEGIAGTLKDVKARGRLIAGVRTDLPPFGSVSYGIGIRKGDEEWLGFVSATLTKMKETGQYQKLLEKWSAEAMALLLGFEKPAVINKVNKEKGR